MDLFDYMRETNKEKESPLASRMRPVTLCFHLWKMER